MTSSTLLGSKLNWPVTIILKLNSQELPEKNTKQTTKIAKIIICNYYQIKASKSKLQNALAIKIAKII